MKITQVSPQKNNSQRVSVFVDGKYSFSLDAADAALRGIRIGKELSQGDIHNLLMESEFTKARDSALNVLAAKSITAKLLCDKLSQKGYDKAVISEVINELTDLGYIDDEAYANMYLEYCLEKLWGKNKIRFEMKKRGLSDELIENAINSVNASNEISSMSDLILSKYGSDNLTDIKTKARITRYFASRGFEFSKIDAAIRVAAKETTDE